MKHFLWLMVAWWTGGAWVLYFADAPTLVKDLATGEAPFIAYAFIGILTFTTYTLAGYMREQVCLYMCPWPRIQAALTDEYALNVTYRYDRGEPRMAVAQAQALRARGEPSGDCTNCKQCVRVCPTGVDIRKGADLGCIQCGLCIDACNAMMSKLGRATGLIAYDTDVNIKRRMEGKAGFVKLVRGRTVLYMALIVATGAFMVYTFATRHDLALAVIHDRNPLAVLLKDGSIRNGYTVRIINKRLQQREFALGIAGPPGTRLEVDGHAATRRRPHRHCGRSGSDARSARADHPQGGRFDQYGAGYLLCHRHSLGRAHRRRRSFPRIGGAPMSERTRRPREFTGRPHCSGWSDFSCWCSRSTR